MRLPNLSLPLLVLPMIDVMNFPSEVNFWRLQLNLSVMSMLPSLSTATQRGSLNFPSSVPWMPNDKNFTPDGLI